MAIDSRIATYEHIQQVQGLLMLCMQDLSQRAMQHDASKLGPPEVEVFDQVTERLAALEYGSVEYMRQLDDLKPALAHHYQHNNHHPEHYQQGIRGMGLLALVEMICDWKAASSRNPNGSLRKSIEINQERFGYSDELKVILLNTAAELEKFEQVSRT